MYIYLIPIKIDLSTYCPLPSSRIAKRGRRRDSYHV